MNEHTPLSGLDELPIHAIPQPIRVVDTTDPRAYERYWFTGFDIEGDVLLAVGFGFYPNLGTAEAYAITVHADRHTTVRAHRRLGDDRSRIDVGPLHAQVIEPFREWRLTLDENEFDLTFDLTWRDTKRATFHQFQAPGGATNLDGRPVAPNVGYETFGRVAGTIVVAGHTLHLDAASSFGSRDHHWGIRNGVGGPGHMEPQPRRSHLGQWVEFRDWSIWGRRCLWNIGDTGHAGAAAVEPLMHRMRFDTETHHLVGGVIRNRFSDGTVKDVIYEQVDRRVAHLRCGMYMGPDQRGTPAGNVFQGSFVGDGVVTGETYDLTDPAVRITIGGFDDHLVTATCGDETTVGLLECNNPVLFEMCRDGAAGFELLQT